MSNAALIERLRHNPTLDLFAEAADALALADKRIAELEAELERERMRLVACGVVAMADTPDSAKEARKMHPDYESAACSDVARRVDECIELRSKLAVARQALESCGVNHGLNGPQQHYDESLVDTALAQIGGEEDTSAHDEAEYYAELNRGYAKDRM